MGYCSEHLFVNETVPGGTRGTHNHTGAKAMVITSSQSRVDGTLPRSAARAGRNLPPHVDAASASATSTSLASSILGNKD